ncbi:MAG: DUF4388 domain-containing protein [Pyrinomonadaceae bacterium]
MGESHTDRGNHEDVESALLDVELFLKYNAYGRALDRLAGAVKSYRHSIRLREKLREVAAAGKRPDEAARQCLALVNLYLARDDYEAAHERLLEARQHDPRISITTGLEAIRRARQQQHHHHAGGGPPQPQVAAPTVTPPAPPPATFAGDLSVISVFDVVQVIENSRLTGALHVMRPDWQGRVLFSEGQIVGAQSSHPHAEPMNVICRAVESAVGLFNFEKAARPYPITLNVPSNTSLLLDALKALDEQAK